jgi:hypothetical protein
MKTAEFGVPCKAPESGRCRICGARPVSWADETRTLCMSADCLEAARKELTTHPEEAESLRRPYEGKRYGFAP